MVAAAQPIPGFRRVKGGKFSNSLTLNRLYPTALISCTVTIIFEKFLFISLSPSFRIGLHYTDWYEYAFSDFLRPIVECSPVCFLALGFGNMVLISPKDDVGPF
uniref:Uncharacterized protein LOC105134625 isoform X1 n=1 Tax=Rhizophora mucronata TaxID=61149 RepID=A0A2P2KSQ9_RHIMU